VAVVRGGLVMVPLGGCEPLQPPEAVQLLALDELQSSVTLCPMGTLLSLDFSVSVGAVISLPVSVPVSVVTAVDVPWHAASAASAMSAGIDFNTNAGLTRLPLRIEFILCLPACCCGVIPAGSRGLEPRGQRSHIHSIFQYCQPVAVRARYMFNQKFISGYGKSNGSQKNAFVKLLSADRRCREHCCSLIAPTI
jgi:hypothetical protein